MTIVGAMSNVSTNRRLYLYEYTPTAFDFLGTANTYSPTDVGRAQVITLTIESRSTTDRFPQAFKADIPNSLPSSTVYFDIDDTGLHWQGVVSTGREDDPIVDQSGNPIDYSHEDSAVQAQYAYLTGGSHLDGPDASHTP